jgi:hypothetical protein
MVPTVCSTTATLIPLSQGLLPGSNPRVCWLTSLEHLEEISLLVGSLDVVDYLITYPSQELFITEIMDYQMCVGARGLKL